MPKSAAERVRKYLARKRATARQSGLCTRCFKTESKIGRTLCTSCRASKTEQTKRKRQRDREASRRQQIVAFQERAADQASEYHLYADAIQYYQGALKSSTLPFVDRKRIADKISRAFFLNGDLNAANLWFERLLAMCHDNPADTAKSVETLFQVHRQQVWECQGDAVFATMRRAMGIAESNGNHHLVKLAQLQRVEMLHTFCRYDEAAEVLANVEPVTEEHNALTRYTYFANHGRAACVVGDIHGAYKNFEAALDLIKEMDPYLASVIWMRYGTAAQELGDTAHAKACLEQALFVAQEYRINWRVDQMRLIYAQLLAWMGQSLAAYSYFREALASSSAPALRVLCACVGIPLALRLKDETTLRKCADTELIEIAFRSKVPDYIGGVAHSFATLYVSQGQMRAARALLHRALEGISDARYNLEVLITVGQHGSSKDIPRARALLEARLKFPSAEVYRAGIALFDAFVARRRGSFSRSHRRAQEAAERFDALQWYGYADIARSIVPGMDRESKRILIEHIPFSHLQPALTARETQVAALVLQGFTNRRIASELRIAQHTVEKHMNSIMNRLGVRSRYQVADILELSGQK